MTQQGAGPHHSVGSSAVAESLRVGVGRVDRPVVLRVAAGHVLADLGPRPGPEPGRSAVTWMGRSAGDRRCSRRATRRRVGCTVPEQVLHAHRSRRRSPRVVDRHRPPARQLAACGRQRVEVGARRPRAAAASTIDQVDARGRQRPVLRQVRARATRRGSGSSAGSDQSGHGSPSARWANPTRSRSARRAGPRQRGELGSPDVLHQRRGRLRAGLGRPSCGPTGSRRAALDPLDEIVTIVVPHE